MTRTLLLLLGLSHYAYSQDAAMVRQVKRIDSLINKYSIHYQQAQQEADSMYQLLNKLENNKANRRLKIEVMLQRSLLFSLLEYNGNALSLALEAKDAAAVAKLPQEEYKATWVIALVYECVDDLKNCKRYLDEAYKIYKQHELDSVYSVYCIRMSSYYRLNKKNDSAVMYAQTGLDTALKYGNEREIRDGYLLLGILLSDNEYEKAVSYLSKAAKKFVEIEDYSSAAIQLSSAANALQMHDKIDKALAYSDSAMMMYSGTNLPVYSYNYLIRNRVFERAGKIDSAYHYYKLYRAADVAEYKKQETLEISRITEQYQNDKKEATIKNKSKQLALIVSLLCAISITSVAIIRKNRKINAQNKIINKQLAELTKTLEQKKVLLSELQHRVKNNLQHVVSILEMQKESVMFNSIEELIRGNQNRIHSMALLHSKLSVSEHISDVDLGVYITELSELVRQSYDNNTKEINLSVICNVARMDIARTLPLGLIIVELVSNSIKHAFGERAVGLIRIVIDKNEATQIVTLHYRDNGCGFDFEQTSDTGLGQEIVKGLIDQLNGSVEIPNKNEGFELLVHFK